QAQATCARLPRRTRILTAQTGKLLPCLPPVPRTEQRGVFDSRIHDIRIRERRFEMPDALELPRMRRAVVPLMSTRDALILEQVADRLPGLASVVRALHRLPEPTIRLRRIDTIRVNRRPLEVIHLPS